MRVINVKRFEAQKRRARRRKLFAGVSIGTVLLALPLGLLWYLYSPVARMAEAPSPVSAAQTPPPSETENNRPKNLRTFSGAEFVAFYDSFAYPNVREFDATLPITGNVEADIRIRALAEQRGYKGRSVAVPPLVSIDGEQLQRLAATDWQRLKDAARADGVRLLLNAGFRTVEDQRNLFLNRLASSGVSYTQIAAGQGDGAVNAVMIQASIPGYTKHHSGYTVDVGCENNSGAAFAGTICFQWLSKDNYRNAKQFGWIPSYPEGVQQQGPEPEAWEYVWVGADALYEP